jgi:hypothetical protein
MDSIGGWCASAESELKRKAGDTSVIDPLEHRRLFAAVTILTLFGGIVNGSTYTLMDNAFNTAMPVIPGTNWTADLNGDGKVDGSDYSILDNAFVTGPHMGTNFSSVPLTTGIASITDPDSGIVVRPQNGNPHYSLDVTARGIIAVGNQGPQRDQPGPEDVILGSKWASGSVTLNNAGAIGTGIVRLITFNASGGALGVSELSINHSEGTFSVPLPGTGFNWLEIDPENNVCELISVYG